MKRKHLAFALAASLTVAVLGAGTAAATGLFSSHHDSTRRAIAAALYDRHPDT